MGATEQNKYIQFVNLLNCKNFFSDTKSSVVSPFLNCLCVVTKEKDAFLYLLPDSENKVEPFWQCPSKVQRCLFSEDGKDILVILNVNSFQIYSIAEKNVSLLSQIKASELTKLLQMYNIDFSAACQVDPLKLNKQELIIMMDKKLIVSIQMSFAKGPVIKYSIALEFYKDVSINEKFIFVSYDEKINAYNIATGEKNHSELNSSSMGQSFFKLTVHSNSKIMAVVNQDEETILLDTTELFNINKNAVETTVEMKKEKWLWPYKNRKTNADLKLNSCKILGKVTPPSGLVVSCLQFSLKGLFVFYCILGQSKCSSFKVIDECSAIVLYTFDGLVESKVICGGPLPLVMTDSILSICLGVLCNDYFIIKLCEAIPSFGFSKELERTLFSQSWNGALQFHLVFLEIIFHLHVNVFNSSLKSLIVKKTDDQNVNFVLQGNFSEKKIIEKVHELFKVVLDYKDNRLSSDFGIKQMMLVRCFLHAVHILDITQVETRGILDSGLFSSLLKQIVILFENVEIEDPLKNDWITWLEMTDTEIIREAVVVGAVALAHVFFVTKRNWPVDEVENKFKAEAHAWIVELVLFNDLEKAKLALDNLGYRPALHLKSLCLNTNDHILRDILVDHLTEINSFTEGEVESWNFNKQLENALSSCVKHCRTFDHKMNVLAKERVNATPLKIPPYCGSIELIRVLNFSKKSRDMILTEVYFNTADVALEKSLKKELCWQYLLETNQVDLLRSWIDIACNASTSETVHKFSDYLSKSFHNLFVNWSITEDMMDLICLTKSMTFTKTYTLDICALYGLFCTAEKSNLKKIVCRLENNSMLLQIRKVLSKPTSNVTLSEFDNMVFSKCVNHHIKPVIVMCLKDLSLLKDSHAFRTECVWVDTWNLFCSWENNKRSQTILKDAILKSSKIYNCSSKESSFINGALAIFEEREISDIIESEGKKCCLLQLPLIEIYWKTSQRTDNCKPDVTLYEMLRCSNMPVNKLFLWQSQNKDVKMSSTHDIFSEFPHFNHQVLGLKFGFKQNLNYIYYLKQGRPSFACNVFVVESLRSQRRLTTKMVKRVCGTSHGLALRSWKDSSIGSACVAFIAMLGDIGSANILRIHLGAVESACRYLPDRDRYYISTLVRGVMGKDLLYVQEMGSVLEKSVMKFFRNEKAVVQFEKWYLAVSFCNIHALPLPSSLLKYLAQNREWFSFVMCMDIFKYPYEQAIELIEEIDSKILKSHLIRALTRTTLKLSTTSPSKSPPKILMEPENNGKDNFESANAKDNNRDVFQSFVTNIYTEVLNTIQNFTDKNIVLPWSCEQDPDNDILLTLLKCESEPDTSKSLLVASIELQSPTLAVLATCFQSENVFPNLIAWLVSSIPTSMSRMKRREEGQQLVDRLYNAKEVETLLVNFFSTGYIQTFFRGMNLFMPENPLTLFLNSIYHSIVLFNFKTSLELLKEFIVEVAHFRAKEPVVLFSKTWILKIIARCIEHLLTRSDLQNSIKRRFLLILAESDLSSLDTCFPNYLLWSQICEVLESSDTNLDFIQLYNPTTVSKELQNCLDILTKNFQFTQALEICSILSLNKDKFVIEMWKHQLDLSIKTNGNIQKVWKDSSMAFKDENVDPNLAASFYYEMASQLQSSSDNSLTNRYYALELCLHWRRLMEDTLSASFREENDAIELQKWKCCIEPNFDVALLKNFDPAETSHSLLLNTWSATKILIRPQVLEEFERKRVDDLINMFLDQEDLQKALRLSAFFKTDNQDLAAITSCLKIAHNEVTSSELAKLNMSTLTKRQKVCLQGQFLDQLNLSEYVIVLSKEQCQMLFLLENLCQSMKHGRSIANKIFVCYRLSVNLDLTFKDIASERDYLSLFSRSAILEGANKLSVVSDLITLTDLSTPDLAKFLRDKIVTATIEFNSTDLAVPVILWDVSLDSDFHLIINLINNPSLLGSELLQASTNLPCSTAVQILIRAHDCFTSSWNVEGIGRVLRRARILASLALQEEQWQYLVKLLVGIKRYSEMNYIFQMLKDNGQFEELLRRGIHKVPGLHVAVSEFLQRHCPQDRELGKMVAAHFGLHSKLATFWQEDADEIIFKIPVTDNILKDSSKTRHALNLAMDNYTHAAQWFLQAGKLNRALKVAHKAQIVALQISMLGGPCILKLQSRAELQTLVNEFLSVSQIMLVSRAYNLQPDWITALHERWILKGDKTFFLDLKSLCLLSPQLIQNYSFKYNLEGIINSKAKERMKQLTINSSHMQSPLLRDLMEN